MAPALPERHPGGAALRSAWALPRGRSRGAKAWQRSSTWPPGRPGRVAGGPAPVRCLERLDHQDRLNGLPTAAVLLGREARQGCLLSPPQETRPPDPARRHRVAARVYRTSTTSLDSPAEYVEVLPEVLEAYGADSRLHVDPTKSSSRSPRCSVPAGPSESPSTSWCCPRWSRPPRPGRLGQARSSLSGV